MSSRRPLQLLQAGRLSIANAATTPSGPNSPPNMAPIPGALEVGKNSAERSKVRDPGEKIDQKDHRSAARPREEIKEDEHHECAGKAAEQREDCGNDRDPAMVPLDGMRFGVGLQTGRLIARRRVAAVGE